MTQPQLSFFQNTRVQGFSYLKSKDPNQACGDALLVKELKNFSYIINCDGVSSSSSPDASALAAIEALEKQMASTRSRRPNTDKILQCLQKLNKKFIKKNLATTLNFLCFSNHFNFHIGLGDSSFYLFNSENQMVFQNWIHNQSKITENHFQKINTGQEHILVNCLGIYQPRYECALDLPIQKGSQSIFHSDGMEQFFKSENEVLQFCKKLNQEKTFDENFFDHNEDDLSLIYLEWI